jgi:hypothetical protein
MLIPECPSWRSDFQCTAVVAKMAAAVFPWHNRMGSCIVHADKISRVDVIVRTNWFLTRNSQDSRPARVCNFPDSSIRALIFRTIEAGVPSHDLLLKHARGPHCLTRFSTFEFSTALPISAYFRTSRSTDEQEAPEHRLSAWIRCMISSGVMLTLFAK